MRVKASSNSGGGTKTASGTFSTQTQVLQTITVSGVTDIDTVCWRMPYYPDNYGFAKKYDSPYNDTLSVAIGSNHTLYPATLGVQSISGNQFTFNWGGNQDFEYTVFGT